MVFNDMPAPAIGIRRPDAAALDRAIAEATSVARAYVAKLAPSVVGEVRAPTMTIAGDPTGAPTSWRVAITITYAVR
jgi:hypothetical protein